MSTKIELITLLARLAILLMTGILIPAVREWLEAHSEHEKINQIKEWAYTAVWAAEQMYNHVEKADPDGSIRKKYAREAIIRMANRCGIIVSSSEINAMIEAAVTDVNSCREMPTKEAE